MTDLPPFTPASDDSITSLKTKQFFEEFLFHHKDDGDKFFQLLIRALWAHKDRIVHLEKPSLKELILTEIKKLVDGETPSEVEASIDASIKNDDTSKKVPPFKLKTLRVTNFRGFQGTREIDFGSSSTIFFGPNGSGKSSLSQAIEFALTGDAHERRDRGFKNSLRDFFQNHKVSSPDFSASISDLNDATIPKDDLFKRCFLEQCRIKKFGRLSANQPADLKKILAELFGIEEIHDFCGEFVTNETLMKVKKETLWEPLLDWDGVKTRLENEFNNQCEILGTILRSKTKLDGAGIKTKLDEIRNETQTKEEVDGTENEESASQKKGESELEKSIKQTEFLIEQIQMAGELWFSSSDLQTKIKKFQGLEDRWSKLQEEIKKKSSKVDFHDLFLAAREIFKKDTEMKECPLCDTPFIPDPSSEGCHVKTDPIKKTEKELNDLKDLSAWQNEQKGLEFPIKTTFDEIKNAWGKMTNNLEEKRLSNFKNSNPESTKQLDNLIADPNFPEIDFSKIIPHSGLNSFEEFLKSAKDQFAKIDFALISSFEEIIKPAKADDQKKLIFKEILGQQQEIKRKKEKLEQHEDRKKEAEMANGLFLAHREFLTKLKESESTLIFDQTKDLNQLTLAFFRALNVDDPSEEEVIDLKIPHDADQKFFIKKADQSEIDSLSSLSEGHLRSLGLSILLARACRDDAPFLIFDDAINAIDSDHRDNIARLLTNTFSESKWEKVFSGQNIPEKIQKKIERFLKRTQLIVTTHDRFFAEKISNLFEGVTGNKKNSSHQTHLIFFGKEGIDDGVVSVCIKKSPFNFADKIQNFLSPQVNDLRSAVFHCRIWLEELVFAWAAKEEVKFGKNKLCEKTMDLNPPGLTVTIQKLQKSLSSEKNRKRKTEEKRAVEILGELLSKRKTDFSSLFKILNQESHHRRATHTDIINRGEDVRVIFSLIAELDLLFRKSMMKSKNLEKERRKLRKNLVTILNEINRKTSSAQHDVHTSPSSHLPEPTTDNDPPRLL